MRPQVCPRHWGICITEHTRSVLYGLCTSSFIYLTLPSGPHSADSVNAFFFLYILRTIFFSGHKLPLIKVERKYGVGYGSILLPGLFCFKAVLSIFLVWKIFLCSIVDGLFDRKASRIEAVWHREHPGLFLWRALVIPQSC